jgi:hypothetical protein
VVIGAPLAIRIIGAGANQIDRFVEGTVEQNVIIGDVEMAVIVDPFRLDLHDGRDEGRKEHGFEFK